MQFIAVVAYLVMYLLRVDIEAAKEKIHSISSRTSVKCGGKMGKHGKKDKQQKRRQRPSHGDDSFEYPECPSPNSDQQNISEEEEEDQIPDPSRDDDLTPSKFLLYQQSVQVLTNSLIQ